MFNIARCLFPFDELEGLKPEEYNIQFEISVRELAFGNTVTEMWINSDGSVWAKASTGKSARINLGVMMPEPRRMFIDTVHGEHVNYTLHYHQGTLIGCEVEGRGWPAGA